MTADQVAKLIHKLILFVIAFLRLIDEYEEKIHTYHPIGRTVNQVIKRRLTRNN